MIIFQVTSSIGNRPLSYVDKSLIVAGDFLKEHMNDTTKLHCLQAFADSFKIVEWIRKETPQGIISVSALKCQDICSAGSRYLCTHVYTYVCFVGISMWLLLQTPTCM